MSGACTVDAARSLALSRAWGVLTAAEMTRHARPFSADARFKPNFRQLPDFREVTAFEVSAPTIRETAALNPFGAGSRRAIVVANDVAFGMARMYRILTEASPGEIKVFRDPDEALRWLGAADAKAEILQALSEAPPLPETV